MDKRSLLEAFVENIPDPVVIADTEHLILYCNPAAKKHFENGEKLEGTSLLDCHNADSRRKMAEVLEKLRNGEEEVQITDKPGQRTYMRAVRDSLGNLLGYYERYTYFPKRVD